jgi:flagellar M-ring protein FliF
MVEHSPVLVKYSALLVGLLLLILLGVRPALSRVKGPTTQAPAGRTVSGNKVEELPAGAPHAQAAMPPHEPTEIDFERQRVQQVFEQVTEQLKQNPSQSSRLLQSWIHSD